MILCIMKLYFALTTTAAHSKNPHFLGSNEPPIRAVHVVSCRVAITVKFHADENGGYLTRQLGVGRSQRPCACIPRRLREGGPHDTYDHNDHDGALTVGLGEENGIVVPTPVRQSAALLATIRRPTLRNIYLLVGVSASCKSIGRTDRIRVLYCTAAVLTPRVVYLFIFAVWLAPKEFQRNFLFPMLIVDWVAGELNDDGRIRTPWFISAVSSDPRDKKDCI